MSTVPKEPFMSGALAQGLSENGLLPDQVIRMGIRGLLRERLHELAIHDTVTREALRQEHIRLMQESPIALLPEKANEQHYEVPAEFFRRVLGEQRKYSCCYWGDMLNAADLDAAEELALKETALHANLKDGQAVLELGCGWGSLSLWMAVHYPNSRIVSVSNSHSQGEAIRALAQQRGLSNLEVVTADMNDFFTDQHFDRVVSVEMFEHMRNWPALFARVQNWLRPQGQFFMHVFVHQTTPYRFEDRDSSDWMSRHFFSGGMMPSIDLPLAFQDNLKLEQRWLWSGQHYARTCNAWLAKMDRQRSDLWPLFEQTYGKDFAKIWWQRWRIFFMACAELFDYRGGNEWLVAHYRFSRR
jgi:cyclopropane-fatty-acyl-phospholipid synthase